MVSSPGGTTIAGIAALEEGGHAHDVHPRGGAGDPALARARAGARPSVRRSAISSWRVASLLDARDRWLHLDHHRAGGPLVGESRPVQSDRALPVPGHRAGAAAGAPAVAHVSDGARPVADDRDPRDLLPEGVPRGVLLPRPPPRSSRQPEVVDAHQPARHPPAAVHVKMFRGASTSTRSTPSSTTWPRTTRRSSRRIALLKEQLSAHEERAAWRRSSASGACKTRS